MTQYRKTENLREVREVLHERKLLRKQLELLAEQSEGAMEQELAELSAAMCKVSCELQRPLLMGFLLGIAVCLKFRVYCNRSAM